MESKIAQALNKLFEKHRIVFWYDSKKQLREEFDALALTDVEKIIMTNNEFGVKYRILREQPDQKFLLYQEGPQPEDINNWLLDVLLANAEFRTDQAAIWLSELELGIEFAEVIENHKEFFQNVKRKESLKQTLKNDDTAGMIKLKMLAVCAGSDSRVDTVLENLLAELASEKDEKIKLIKRCNLDVYLWELLKRAYGYESQTPSIKDFAVELFKSCYEMATSENKPNLNNDALVFLKRWKDSRKFESSFETISGNCAEILDIEADLNNQDYRKLVDIDYFKLIDKKVISDLINAVSNKTISVENTVSITRQRRNSHWYNEFSNVYDAIEAGVNFIHLLDKIQLDMDSLEDGITRYTNTWYKLDQLYRKFIYHLRTSGLPSILARLTEQVENLYINNYLLKVNNNWQRFVDDSTNWNIPKINAQRDFYREFVSPHLNKGNKIFVIISDGMRYEIGEELLNLIRKEDRFEASLKPAVTMLPSYTQLGMAALLPNKELSLNDNDTGTVSVNGQTSQGTANRTKILEQSVQERAIAIKADELLSKNIEECRSILRKNDVIYIYQNRIDHVGDKRESEERVFDEVEDTLVELIKLIKKLTNANANNILITSDHGFIYQNKVLDESDFADAEASGNVILFRDRRFVLGKGLAENKSLKKYSSKELGLVGDIEVQIPKSINRLRLKGSGSRYVHGGATLQEIVIPIIEINKKRQSDVSVVEVEIIRTGSSVISSGQQAVVLYQTTPASEKIHSRVLRAGIYNNSGELISDSKEFIFDLTSENSRDREIATSFLLTQKANEANGQEVKLKLEEKVPNTSHYKEYKSIQYTMRRSFTSDFDF